MLTKIRRIGTSLGLTIPKRIMDQAGLREGQEVSLTAIAGVITITAEAHLDVSLTLEEAKALVAGEKESEAATSARDKIRGQIENTTERKN